MKKTALALAIAGSVGAAGIAAADTILYGSARPSVDYVKYQGLVFDLNDRLPPDQRNQELKDLDSGYWDVVDNTSRLGVRGSEDLGGGLSAIYQFEFGVDMTDGGNFVSNRPKWVGLKGESWGALTLGTQWTPYYNVLGVADVFNSVRTFGIFTFNCLPIDDNGQLNPDFASPQGSGAFCGTAYLGPYRYDNSVLYSTPSWNGLSAQAMLIMNGLQNSSNEYYEMGDRKTSIDAYDLNIKYENGPWFAGVAFDRLEGDRRSDLSDARSLWGVGLGYNVDAWGLTFNFENAKTSYIAPADINDLNSPLISQDFKTNNYYVVGRYTFGSNTLRLAYGYFNPRDFDKFGDFAIDDPLLNGDDGLYPDQPLTASIDGSKVQNVVAGWEYGFSKRTLVWVEYIGQFSSVDLKVQQSTPGTPGTLVVSGNYPFPDQNAVSVGMRHDF